MDDNALLKLYLARSELAVEATEEAYGAYCHTIACRILGNEEDAEETLNDTWLHAWNSIPPQQPRHFRAYLAKLTRNLAFDRYRKQTAEKRGGTSLCAALDELELCLPSEETVESVLDAKELQTSIERFLNTLSSREEEIFLRRYFYVEEITDIAARFGLKENNVLTILSRTRKKLKKHLTKEGYFV